MTYKLSPSILSADFTQLGNQIQEIDKAGSQYLHIDVMDGEFVPCISFGMPLIKSVRKCTDIIFDVHLMVREPERYIDDFAACGADILTVHAEACTHLERTLGRIKEKKMKAGIALNPATPLCCLDYILDKVDMILIMTVNPGFGGQKYIGASTGKIKELHKIIKESGSDIDIEVDGGITKENFTEVLEAGANVTVMGSSIFNGDMTKNTKYFLEIMKQREYL